MIFLYIFEGQVVCYHTTVRIDFLYIYKSWYW